MKDRVEITKDEFLSYEEVRLSGATNMFDANMVEKLSGLSREKIIYIMKNYRELKDKYLPK